MKTFNKINPISVETHRNVSLGRFMPVS